MDICKILIESFKLRGIFHSEADFQHHFAWAIQNAHSNAEIRLEYPIEGETSKRKYCDIFLKSPECIGIELKYKTKRISCPHKDKDKYKYKYNGEIFELKNQSAYPLGRYDFLKDISRLENWLTQEVINYGYAIILSNDKAYWKPPKGNPIDSEFRIHNRTISGKLSWSNKASEGTTRGRESITLKGEYTLEWIDSVFKEFKYLVVQVKKSS